MAYCYETCIQNGEQKLEKLRTYRRLWFPKKREKRKKRKVFMKNDFSIMEASTLATNECTMLSSQSIKYFTLLLCHTPCLEVNQ